MEIGEFVDFRSGLLAFLRANAEPPRYAAGSHLFAFPAGVEQASAPIYINGPKNTGFFKNYVKQTRLIFVKSTCVIKYSVLADFRSGLLTFLWAKAESVGAAGFFNGLLAKREGVYRIRIIRFF